MSPPDPRRTPWRADLAATGLEGRVPSRCFVAGVLRQLRVGSASLKAAPHDDAEQASQLLYGEQVSVYEDAGGWSWVQNHTDGYVGYVRSAALGTDIAAPTHRVGALRSFLFPEPNLRTPPREALSLTAPVTVTGERNGWAALSGGGWVFAQHLTPLDRVEPDIAATACRLLGVPYLWGGRTSLGIDCSGLVQIALATAGTPAPRDSDMQRAETGESLGPVAGDGQGVALRRGDIVFFPGHVGIMIDAHSLVHATAFVMAVTIEPLAGVIARTDPTRGGGLLAVRRL